MTDRGRSAAEACRTKSEATGDGTTADGTTEPEATGNGATKGGATGDGMTTSEAAADRVSLVAVCGLPGVGKTTVAERIASHVDGDVLRTDVIRKELFSDPEYTDAETARVYAELVDRARDRVADGESVVLDATFADRRFRADVEDAAAAVADRFELVKVECDEAVVRRRIERREGISDADFDVHLHFKKLFEPVERDHVVVDNSGARTATLDRIDAAFS